MPDALHPAPLHAGQAAPLLRWGGGGVAPAGAGAGAVAPAGTALMAPPRPGVGDMAPDFSLPGTGGGTYRLSDYRGRPVVLVFYPGDNTPVCTTQLTGYSADISRFEDVGAQVLAISPQGLDSHEQFARVHSFRFPLLSDTDRSVGRSYGVVGPIGFYKRSVVVVDGEGVIRYAHRATAGLTFRSTEQLVAGVRAAQSAGHGG